MKRARNKNGFKTAEQEQKKSNTKIAYVSLS
jgi:hypothetical protein